MLALLFMATGSVAVPQKLANPSCSCPASPSAAGRRADAPPAGAGQHAGQVYPPGTIDGAKDPELIPDDVAYKMLFLSIMEPDNPTDAQKARQESKLRLIRFSDADKAAFLTRLGEFRD
jgi:hypothetical protein